MAADRIVGLRRVRASILKPHPRNWRTHPPAQRAALAAVLDEIGYADALVARLLPDGSLELIDGHLRAETTPDQEVPVLVLDVTEEEAEKLIATLDPLVMMAEVDREALSDLANTMATRSEELRTFIKELSGASDVHAGAETAGINRPAQPEALIPESYQVLVECADESVQRTIYERLTAEGYRCRVLTI